MSLLQRRASSAIIDSVDIDIFAEAIINYACGIICNDFNAMKNSICKQYEKFDSAVTRFHNTSVREIQCTQGILLKITQKNKTYMFKATKQQADVLRAYYYVYNIDKIIAKEHTQFKQNMPQFVNIHWRKFNENIQILLDAIQVHS